jgi:hypothetical protein
MTNAGQSNMGARIKEAKDRVLAGGLGALWWSVVRGFEFDEQPLVMSRLWHLLPADQRVVAISSAWPLADPPGKFLPLGEWVEKFRDVGYISDERGWATRATPPEQITLWRGGINENGLSWTADRNVAVKFQHRFDPPGKLWTATVGAEHLLAHFNVVHRPGEHEYVVDPAGLDPTEVPTVGG